MNIIKKIFNVFGILFAFILSIVLFVALIGAPVISAVSSFTQIDNLKIVVSQIDFSEWEVMEESSESEMVTAVVKTDLLADIIELYIEDIFLTLEESTAERNLTPDAVKSLANEHMDELIPIAKEMMRDELLLMGTIKDEDISKIILQVLEEEAEGLIEAFPTVEDLGIDDDVILGLKYLRNGIVLYAVLGVVAVLSVLILLFRCVRWKGFMWLGVVYLLATGITLLEAVGISKGGATITAAYVPESEGLVTPIFATLGAELYKSAGVMALLAAAFIAIYVTGRKICNKKVFEPNANLM